jgi:1,2-diacylglycerol 3-beta-galactosyltransferase
MRIQDPKRPLRVLLLFSDTGGGHRSAAEALVEAWHHEHPGRVHARMVDVFRHYTPFPFSLAGPSYPLTIKHFSRLWKAGFYALDTPSRAWRLARATYGYVRPRLRRLLLQHSADAIVSVHPLFNHWIGWTRRELGLRTPYVTVVTDLYTAHAFWFYPHVDRIFVPTAGARARGIDSGVPSSRIVVRGLPVTRKFATNTEGTTDRAVARAKLGLDKATRLVLLVGGGDGMGPMEKMARAIDDGLLTGQTAVQLVIIAGRNAALRKRLEALPWRRLVRVEGFVRNMPDWMAAADVLVTKAGPGTITEGLLSGLPLLLIGKVPGQEDGNVDLVVSEGVGAWEPHPQRAAAILREWLTSASSQLTEMSDRARQFAVPTAASDIAADILALAAGHAGAARIRRDGHAALTA